ncbi:MAG: C1 family peptidase [Firmicutes bacterium]|nr:C1 family peptidase [Bacillota bacterium]
MRKSITILLSLMTVFMALSATNVLSADETYNTGLGDMTDEMKEILEENGRIKGIDNDNDLTLYSVLPSSVDNSESEYFPEIGDQGNYGSCVAYATTYYQMSYTISKALDTKYVFNPLWTYSLINAGADDGSYVIDAYDLISNLGVPLYDEFTGDALEPEPNADVWKSAMKYKIDPDNDSDNWYEVCDDGDTDAFINSVKLKLNDGDILTTGTLANWWYGENKGEDVTLSKDGVTIDDDYGIPYIYNKDSDEGRHLVTIVGYDDDIVMSYTYDGQEYTTTGAFKIANSWGDYWGNDGFAWVAYDAFYKSSSNRPSEHDGYGFTSAWYGSESVYYIMELDDDYELYTPQYTMSLEMDSTSLRSMYLYYKTKENGSSSFSSQKTLFSEDKIFSLRSSSHHEFPTSYTGEIAVDISDMADYMSISDDYFWEIDTNKSNDMTAKFCNSDDSLLNSSTGTEWYEQHEHTFSNAVSDSAVGDITRKCSVCGKTITVKLSKNFESGVDTSQWFNNGNAVLSSVTEDDGNTYMQIDYEKSDGSEYNYYGVFFPDNIDNMNISGNMYMSFDIYFGSNSEDLMLTNASSYDEAMDNATRNYVLRLCRRNDSLAFGGSLKNYNNRYFFYDDDGEFVSADDKWFTVEIYANISETGAQSIYVKDRDSGDLIVKVEEFNIAHPTDSCNLFALGGRDTMKIDNIIITQD